MTSHQQSGRAGAMGRLSMYAAIRDKLIEHKRYIAEYGEDMPEIRNWQWAAEK